MLTGTLNAIVGVDRDVLKHPTLKKNKGDSPVKSIVENPREIKNFRIRGRIFMPNDRNFATFKDLIFVSLKIAGRRENNLWKHK